MDVMSLLFIELYLRNDNVTIMLLSLKVPEQNRMTVSAHVYKFTKSTAKNPRKDISKPRHGLGGA